MAGKNKVLEIVKTNRSAPETDAGAIKEPWAFQDLQVIMGLSPR